MSEFGRPQFESLMSEAVRLHGEGQYEAALASSTQAYKMAPDDSLEKGRAARDNSAHCGRLGLIDDAGWWALEAYTIHDGLVQSMDEPTRKAFRERSASAMYVGLIGLRKAIQSMRGKQGGIDSSTITYMRQAWSDLRAANSLAPSGINRWVDQYGVNVAWRVSLAETLLGDRKKGFAIGARAVGLAFMSESPKLDTSNPNLSTKQRMRAKVKALVGGVAAVTVSSLASPKDNRRHQAALALADRML